MSEAASEAVAPLLFGEISGREAISSVEFETICGFYDAAPHTNGSIVNLMFNACLKAGHTAPLKVFEYSLRFFEEFPDVLSGEGQLHPGYVYRPSNQRTFEKCPICGGSGKPYYCAFSYRINTFGHPHLPFKLWEKCEQCGNLYTYKFAEEFLSLSTRHEFIQPDPNKRFTAAEHPSGMSLPIWSNILNKLKGYTDGKNLLEVGIGKGELLAVALEMGYDADAVEIVPESAREVSDILGIPIWNGDFLKYESDKKYQIIIMGDVIEHVTDPEAALLRAYELLDDNGTLWLSTPNYESSFSRLMKFNDVMWSEPYHISYFSFDGLNALLQKCGFTVSEYSVSNRYNGSMELILIKKR